MATFYGLSGHFPVPFSTLRTHGSQSRSFTLIWRTFFFARCIMFASAARDREPLTNFKNALAFVGVCDVFCLCEGLEDGLFGAFLNFHEFIELPLPACPDVIALTLRTVDQFMSVQVRQAVGIASIIPVIIALSGLLRSRAIAAQYRRSSCRLDSARVGTPVVSPPAPCFSNVDRTSESAAPRSGFAGQRTR